MKTKHKFHLSFSANSRHSRKEVAATNNHSCAPNSINLFFNNHLLHYSILLWQTWKNLTKIEAAVNTNITYVVVRTIAINNNNKNYKHNRQEQVIMTWLRIGHTNITHEHLMANLHNNMCETCDKIIIVRHILSDCQLYIPK